MKKVLWLAVILASLVFIIPLNRLIGGKYYQVVKPRRDNAVQVVYATGTVEATVMIPIAARTSARLMELLADEGSEIKKDQVLARLEDTDVRQSLKELMAKEELAKNNFERAKSLISQNAISKGEFDIANSNLLGAKALVAAAEAQLSYLTLRAPEDGKIIRRDGEMGQLIAVNEPVFWISCCAPLRVSAEVDEEDIAIVKPGQKVLIRADAFPGKVFNGTVLSITPKGDPVARSYRVRIGFTDENPLLIGMTAETNIIIRESKDALIVPTATVKQDKVWIIRDHKAVQTEVVQGAAGLGSTEIVSGINQDDFVILKPDSDLKQGESVRTTVIEQEF